MFFVYIIKSITNGKHYIGHTSDIDDRLNRHNLNYEKATKGRGPWDLVYKERYEDKSSAAKREYYLKRLKNRKYIEKIILNQT